MLFNLNTVFQPLVLPVVAADFALEMIGFALQSWQRGGVDLFVVAAGVGAETAGGGDVKFAVGRPGDKAEMTAGDEFAALGLLIFDFSHHFASVVAVNRRL